MEIIAPVKSKWIEMVQKIENKEISLSFSSIKEFTKSPRHFMEYKLGDKVTTDAMKFGSMVHCFILEPDEFENRYYAMPKVDKRTKAGKVEWAMAIENLKPGQETVEAKDIEHAKRIADSIMRNDAANWVFSNIGETEKAVQWEDYGYKWRGFIDGDGEHLTADLKIVADANPKKFKWKIWEMLYHWQAAMYTRKGLKQKKDYFIVAADRSGNVTVIQVNIAVMEQALDQIHQTMKLFKKCTALNEWKMSYNFYGPHSGIYKLSEI